MAELIDPIKESDRQFTFHCPKMEHVYRLGVSYYTRQVSHWPDRKPYIRYEFNVPACPLCLEEAVAEAVGATKGRRKKRGDD